MIAQKLMGSFCVVEGKPVPDSVSGLSRSLVFVGRDLFVLETSPEPFREDVVGGSPVSVHADLDVSGPETVEIAVADEMRSRVAFKMAGEAVEKARSTASRTNGISKV